MPHPVRRRAAALVASLALLSACAACTATTSAPPSPTPTVSLDADQALMARHLRTALDEAVKATGSDAVVALAWDLPATPTHVTGTVTSWTGQALVATGYTTVSGTTSPATSTTTANRIPAGATLKASALDAEALVADGTRFARESCATATPAAAHLSVTATPAGRPIVVFHCGSARLVRVGGAERSPLSADPSAGTGAVLADVTADVLGDTFSFYAFAVDAAGKATARFEARGEQRGTALDGSPCGLTLRWEGALDQPYAATCSAEILPAFPRAELTPARIAGFHTDLGAPPSGWDVSMSVVGTDFHWISARDVTWNRDGSIFSR